MKPYTPKTESWFKKRIGKRVFRDTQGSAHDKECATCARVTQEGIIIHDEAHAEYLATVDNEFSAEGIFSNYRDTL